MTQEQAEKLQVAQARCLKPDFLFFTRYFFKSRYGRKFVIGEHHLLIAEALQKVFSGEIKRLIINIAPRYGKTELAVKNFIAHGLAINPAAKFIHLSYSDDLALDNSEDTKDLVSSAEYRQLFPDVEIKKDSKAKKKWYTTKGGGVYATAAAGQVTGFGAGQVDEEEEEEEEEEDFSIDDDGVNFGGALIIDDPLKPEDADSDVKRVRVNSRYDSTISNRVNSRNTPIIIIMQRLHEEDLCGFLLGRSGAEEWTVLSLSSIKKDGTALWPFKHTIEELRRMEKLNPLVFGRQHMQHPMPMSGRLYKQFKTYTDLPVIAKKVKAVVDTADTGADYLCSIVYMPTVLGHFVIDVYYTSQGMEVTEQATALQLTKYGVHQCKIESNNGGRGFARNVERSCREMGNTKTIISWFHQKDNKHVRIFSKAADVQNMIYYPFDWETRWPDFARHVKAYMAAGKNAHDDAEDCLTLIIETENTKKGIKVGIPSGGDTQSNQWEKWMDESISAPDPREEMREQEEYFEDEE